MKRIICSIIVVLLLSSLFVACSSKKENDTVYLDATVENKDKSLDITVQSPITLSNNDMFPINEEHQYLRLKMVKGKYYEDWTPGAYMGTIWEGAFILELTDESENTIAQTDLSEIYNENLIFNSTFDIQFDDYNSDGDLDFTIGQYVSSNGRNYVLFTLRKDGQIEKLPIKDYSTLFISNTTGYYSTQLTKKDKITFKKEYYDNLKQKFLEDIFRWDGNEFIHVKSNTSMTSE